tara:strand:- start:5606 stop:6109 length:504 start_codon:yes stop_codon:yes gene_type:complete
MAFISFKLIGVKKAVKVFKSAESVIVKELKDIMNDVIKNEMVATAKEIAPKDTGLLRANIRGFTKIMGKTVIGGLRVSTVPYAAIQEFGGTTHPVVTAKMKRFFWFKFFSGGEVEQKWKKMALMKIGKKLTVKIPASPYLRPAIEKHIPLLRKKIQKELKNLGERKI